MVENVPTYPKAEETIYNVAEIAKKVRAFIKSNYPKSKYSVSKKDNTLNVKLMKSPKMPFTDEYRKTEEYKNDTYWSVNQYGIERDERLEDWIKEELQHIVNYANQWNWDRSDIQTDYFDVNFYWNLGIGKWDKPFEYTGAPLEDEEEETNLSVQDLAIQEWLNQIINYGSAKGVIERYVRLVLPQRDRGLVEYVKMDETLKKSFINVFGGDEWSRFIDWVLAEYEEEINEIIEDLEYSEVKLNLTDGLKYRYSKKLYAESPTDALAGIQFQDPEYPNIWGVYNFPENYEELQRWKTSIFKIFPELAVEERVSQQNNMIGFSRVETSDKFKADYKYPIFEDEINDDVFRADITKMRFRVFGYEGDWDIIDYDDTAEGWLEEMYRLFPELEPKTPETSVARNEPQFDVGDYIKYPQAEEYGRIIAIRVIDINNPNLGYEYTVQYPNGDIITIGDIDHPVKLEGDIDDGRGRELTEMGKCQFDMELINRTTAVREFVTKYGEIIYSINKNEIICKLVEAVHKFAEYELCADELPAVAKSATLSLKDKLKKLKKK
jgi:hypothetical protein